KTTAKAAWSKEKLETSCFHALAWVGDVLLAKRDGCYGSSSMKGAFLVILAKAGIYGVNHALPWVDSRLHGNDERVTFVLLD
ncbi:MAG: hypothetical protein R8M45_09995, partial [Ghiorsea sp.]